MNALRVAASCAALLLPRCQCDVPALACDGDGDCPAASPVCKLGVCASTETVDDVDDGSVGDGEGEGKGEGEGEGEGDPGPFSSCRELLEADPATPSGTHPLLVEGVVIEVECDMTTAGGGWTRLLRLREGDACPGTMVAAPRGCGRGTLATATATLAPLHPFTELRGVVHALGSGGADGFRDQAPDADQRYLDGVALTVGQPRRHVFAFANGLSDGFGTASLVSECPCAGGTGPPAFVGTAYVCEAPRASVLPDGTRLYDNDDVLFDGAAIDDPVCAVSFESAPDFQAAVGAATKEDVQLHVMMSQDPSDEDLAIISVDLWIR